MSARVLVGADAVAALPRLADLHAATDTPITARSTWLTAWARSRPAAVPRLVLVEDEGAVVAAAPLAVLAGRVLSRVVAWGHEDSDAVRLPAVDAAAADRLAAALAADLRSLRGPWVLRLEQLPADDPVVTALTGRHDGLDRVVGDGSPVTRFGPDRSLAAHLSRNGRRTVNSARNRVARAGVSLDVAVATGPDEVRRLLPAIVELRRARDHALGRPSAVDRPERYAFFTTALPDLAAAGELELSTAHVDGQLAAYVVGLRDGGWLRLWDGRFDPRWYDLGIGRILDAEVLTRALADPALCGLDWMRGEEEYKARAANDVVAACHLVGASSSAVAAATSALPRARGRARALLDAHPGLRRRYVALKRVALRRRGR